MPLRIILTSRDWPHSPLRVTVRASSPRDALAGVDVETRTADILDAAAMRRALRGVERVFHVAGTNNLRKSAAETLRVNAEGTRTVLDASYSRDNESAADAFAIETMRKLGRSPRPMGELLYRITGAQANKSITILASHPLTEERLATMKEHDRPATGAPLLSDVEWNALKSACK